MPQSALPYEEVLVAIQARWRALNRSALSAAEGGDPTVVDVDDALRQIQVDRRTLLRHQLRTVVPAQRRLSRGDATEGCDTCGGPPGCTGILGLAAKYGSS